MPTDTTDTFVASIKGFISKTGLPLPHTDKPMIVALSGGADSVALLSVMTTLGYKCIAAHCNYHLRGEESDRDELHARSIAKQLNVPILVEHFDVGEYRSATNESSIEVACRDLRYRWFEELRQRHNGLGVAVGHNSDDNCETAIFNLLRGSGISGLRGMLAKNERHVIRPMLTVSRTDIEQYLNRMRLTYITDSSNLTNDYSRNKIRNQILPEIKRYFPDARNGMLRTISNIQDQEKLYRQLLEDKKKLYTTDVAPVTIDLKKLIENEPSAALMVYEWFKSYGLSRTQAENIIAAANSTGATFSSADHIWTIDRGSLIKIDNHGPSAAALHDLYDIEEHDISEFHPDRNPDIAYFDASKIKITDLSVRYPQTGDRIKPFGMKGTKLVSDILAEARVPAALKNRIPLLMNDKEILWISGIRASSMYKVTDKTTSFLKIRYKKQTKYQKQTEC